MPCHSTRALAAGQTEAEIASFLGVDQTSGGSVAGQTDKRRNGQGPCLNGGGDHLATVAIERGLVLQTTDADVAR